MESNLSILNSCDSHPDPLHSPQKHTATLSNYTFFKYEDVVLGYMLPFVAEALKSCPPGDWRFATKEDTVMIDPRHNTFESRSKVISRTLHSWRQDKKFVVLNGPSPSLPLRRCHVVSKRLTGRVGWRDELYPVYGPHREVLFAMERS